MAGRLKRASATAGSWQGSSPADHATPQALGFARQAQSLVEQRYGATQNMDPRALNALRGRTRA